MFSIADDAAQTGNRPRRAHIASSAATPAPRQVLPIVGLPFHTVAAASFRGRAQVRNAASVVQETF